MDTKDLVYMGLIAFAATIFYWHGYFAALDKPARKAKTQARGSSTYPSMTITKTSTAPQQARQTQPAHVTQTAEPAVQCFFGNN